MTKDYSADASLNFMDVVRNKHYLKPATARARKAALKKMIEVMDNEEKHDVRRVDLDALHERFANKEAGAFSTSSLQVYRSRFRSALKDFISYTDDPTNFRVTLHKSSGVQKTTTAKKKPKADRGYTPTFEDTAPPSTIVFPIPIRTDLTVTVHGIPSDLTTQEAEKIAAVVKALAVK